MLKQITWKFICSTLFGKKKRVWLEAWSSIKDHEVGIGSCEFINYVIASRELAGHAR